MSERDESAIREPQSMRYGQLLIWSLLVGLAGGLLSALYYVLMQGGIYLVWELALPVLRGFLPYGLALLALMSLGGLLVGLAIRRMGRPGEIAAVVDNIHMKHGKIDGRATPSMVVISLVSIVFGGSAGPEAPLVQIIGSLASRLGGHLRLRGEHVRMLTFCGMAAALGRSSARRLVARCLRWRSHIGVAWSIMKLWCRVFCRRCPARRCCRRSRRPASPASC